MMNLEEFLIKFEQIPSESKSDILELISGYLQEEREETLEAIIEIVENKPLEVKIDVMAGGLLKRSTQTDPSLDVEFIEVS